MPYNTPNDVRLGILGNYEIWKKIRMRWRQNTVTNLPSRNKSLAMAVKNYTKADAKLSVPLQFCLISLLSFIYFVRDIRSFCHYGPRNKWMKWKLLDFSSHFKSQMDRVLLAFDWKKNKSTKQQHHYMRQNICIIAFKILVIVTNETKYFGIF